MNIDLRQLRHFVAVAEELHFGRAAARLHMTQPPLSQSIQTLEAALGCELFFRTRRSVQLTPAGQALLPEAQRMLLQVASLPALVRRAAEGESGSLSLAFISTADYSILPSLLREFRQAYPHVHIELRESTTDIQLEDLAQGRIDAGLLIPPLPERLKAELDYLPVLSESLIAALPQGAVPNKPRGAGALHLRSLNELPLIIFPREIAPALHDAILGCFRDAGLTPYIGQEAIQMQTIVGLVSAGMGMALVPQSVSNLKRPGVEYRSLHDKTPQVETGLAWRRNNSSPVLRAFLEHLRKTQ